MIRSGSAGSLLRLHVTLLALALPLSTMGCSFASVAWHDTRRVPGYVVPARIPLVVDASEAAVAADQGGYIDTMVLTVREELGNHGVESTILSPKPSRMPSPRVELVVRAFDEGDYAESYATQTAITVATAGWVPGVPLAGYMNLRVLCRAYDASNQLMFEGAIEGSASGQSNPRDLAEAAGDKIAEGLTDAETTRPMARWTPNR
jgi:hypothetical protein